MLKIVKDGQIAGSLHKLHPLGDHDQGRTIENVTGPCMQSPTPAMRALSMAGSGLFLGILGYFYFQDKPQPQSQRQKSTQ